MRVEVSQDDIGRLYRERGKNKALSVAIVSGVAAMGGLAVVGMAGEAACSSSVCWYVENTKHLLSKSRQFFSMKFALSIAKQIQPACH